MILSYKIGKLFFVEKVYVDFFRISMKSSEKATPGIKDINVTLKSYKNTSAPKGYPIVKVIESKEIGVKNTIPASFIEGEVIIDNNAEVQGPVFEAKINSIKSSAGDKVTLQDRKTLQKTTLIEKKGKFLKLEYIGENVFMGEIKASPESKNYFLQSLDRNGKLISAPQELDF